MKFLGKGGEACVYGPFSYVELISLFPNRNEFSKLPSGKSSSYIVKLFHEKVKETIKNRMKELQKIPYPDSIILPLLFSSISTQEAKHKFDFQPKKDIPCVDVEIQKYGGDELYMFLNKSSTKLRFRDFKDIYTCFQKILADFFVYVYKYGWIVTDVKPENMVIRKENGKYVVRVIDLQANPKTAPSRMITTYLQLLPIQYFHSYFKTTKENWSSYEKSYIQNAIKKYNQNSQQGKLMRQIHNNMESFENQVFPLFSKSNIDPLDTTFFVALYPIFCYILWIIITNKIILKSQEEKEIIQCIKSFCIRVLKRRGKVLRDKDPNVSINRFLQEMNLCFHHP